jgi:hypothetical protein
LFNEIKALPNRNDLADVWERAVAAHCEKRNSLSESTLYRF